MGGARVLGAAIALVVFLVPAGSAAAVQVEGNAAGDTVAVFSLPYGKARYWAAFKPAGQEFGPSVQLTPKGAFRPSAAVAPDGTAIVTWELKGSVMARIRPPGGDWGAPVTVAAARNLEGGPELAVDGTGNALVAWSDAAGLMSASYRPAGAAFGAPELMPGKGTIKALAMDGAGEAIAISAGGSPSNGVLQSSIRPPAGAFGEPTTVAPIANSYGVALAMSVSGAALVAFSQDKGIAAASREPAGAFGAPVRVSDKHSEPFGTACYGPTVEDAALAGDGTGTITWGIDFGVDYDTCGTGWTRQWMSAETGDGTFAAPVELTSPRFPGGSASAAANEEGDTAVSWGLGGFDVAATYRPARSSFGAPFQLAGPRRGGADDVAIDGSGRATAAWDQNDGERDRVVARGFGATGASGPAVTLRARPAYTHRRDGFRRCHPPGSRVLLRTREAVVFRQTRSPNRAKYGCFFKRGRPVALDWGFEDFPVTTSPPPAMALAGPLVASYFLDEECGACGGQQGIEVIDLRTGLEADGFAPYGQPYAESVRRIVLRRDAAVAWLSRAGSIFKLDAGAARAVRIAHGKNIDPRYLHQAHGRVYWRQGGRRRSAPLR